MELYRILTDVIDMRSFSNLWYWIVLAVLWSRISHRLMGVPFDQLQAARRHGGRQARDAEDLARITSRRFLAIIRASQVTMLFGSSFALTVTGLLAFRWNVEFAQALFFLGAPMLAVGGVRLLTALRIEAGENSGELLWHRLLMQRRMLQAIGMVSIFITALYGMWRNLNISVLN